MCGCGCKGWCSLHPLLEAFRADLVHPHSDLRLPLLDLKGDWPAVVSLFGMRTWSHNIHPCPLCTAKKPDLADVSSSFTASSSRFPEFDEGAYHENICANFRETSPAYVNALGPLSTFITHSIRALLATPIWKPAIAGLDKEENEKLALLALKAELWTHYKARRETDAEWRVKGSEVGGLDT